MCVRWIDVRIAFVFLFVTFVLQPSSHAQQNQPPLDERNQVEIYQSAVDLYQQGRYHEAIEQFQLAYKHKALAGILLNIANAYRRLVRNAPRTQALIQQAITNFDHYLLEEHDAVRCEVMHQRAEIERLRRGQSAPISKAALALESVSMLDAAFQRTRNITLMRCIGRAHLEYARELPPSPQRLDEARRALTAFRSYFHEAAVMQIPVEAVVVKEQEEAQLLLAASR